MNTLIVYATSHGCTEQCAEKVRSGLDGDVTLVNLKKHSKIDPAPFETVIVGGSIHAGRIQGRVKTFCRKNEEVLLKRKLGLFICHMEEKEAQKEFDASFPEALRNHATARGLFGGEFDFEKMNFLSRVIVKKVAGMTESVRKVSDDVIEKFIQDIKK